MGLLLRFVALDAMEFKGDEFKAYFLAAAHLQHGVLPQVGLISSTGLFNPPFFILLLWLPLLFSKDPVFMTGWIVLLNAAGVIGLFFLLKRLGGTMLALLSTTIVATSPWLFLFSRKIWAQDALFPLLILTEWLLLSYARDRKPWQLWCAAASMALMTQLHMSTWFIPLAALLWVALLRLWPRLIDALVALVIFVAFYLPYIVFHIQDGFQNLQRTTTDNAANVVEQLRWMIGINGAVGLDYMWGPQTPAAISPALHSIAALLTWLMGLGAVMGLMIAMREIMKRSSWLRVPGHLSSLQQYVVFLVCVAVVTLIGFQMLGVPDLPFYHLTFLPLVPLLVGIALTSVPKNFDAASSVIVLAVAGVFLGLIVSMQSVFMHHPDQLHGDYGVPYRHAKATWAPYIEGVKAGRVKLPE